MDESGIVLRREISNLELWNSEFEIEKAGNLAGGVPGAAGAVGVAGRGSALARSTRCLSSQTIPTISIGDVTIFIVL